MRLAPDVLRDARVEVAPVVRESLPEVLTVTGQLQPDPALIARIATPVAGRIERVLVEEGQHVRKGQPLFVVRVPDLGKLRAGERAMQARARAAEANAARLESLVGDRLAAEQAWLDAQAQADALALEAQSLKEQLSAIGAGETGNPSELTLRATTDGDVVTRPAVAGQPATADQTLGTIGRLSELWFLAHVFENDLGRVRAGAAADVTLNAFPGRHFAGQVEYLGAELDPTTRAVNARIRVANPDGRLRVGLFGEAQLRSPAAAGAPALVVPESALTDVNGKPTVFVERGPGDFEPRPVAPGPLVYPRQAIGAGLREGERVAVRGVFTLKAAYLRSSLEED